MANDCDFINTVGCVATCVDALASLILGICALWVTYAISKSDERENLRNSIDKMIEISMDYPYVEQVKFCAAYPDCDDDRDPYSKDRYENFCIFVFNSLTRIYEYCGHNTFRMKQFIFFEEILCLHYAWWEHDANNVGYSKLFREFVDTQIDKMRKAGRIK